MEIKGMIFDIQRFSTHDGPGIRTTVFFKGCPLRCKWCSNPESQQTRPDIFYKEQNCIGCGKCVISCPSGIPVGLQGIDSSCTYCGNCARICPTNAIEMKGNLLNTDEIIEEIERDTQYYWSSNGGVTLSGGEPLMQPLFAEKLARETQSMGYHTAIETTGYAKWEDVKRVFENVDLVLYDLKHINSDIHAKNTGVKNDLIIDNLRKSAAEGYNIIVRFPYIGGFNMSAENLNATVDLLSDIGIGSLDILPYHTYGYNKYKMLRKEYTFIGDKPSKEDIAALKEICVGKDIEAHVE